MKVIDVRIKFIKNEFYFKFTNRTTEDDIYVLNIVKDKLYEICKLLLLKNCIHFEDLKSFSFYIDQGENPKARKNSCRKNSYFAQYSKNTYDEDDLCINYYWHLPFTKYISRNIIDILEGSMNENNLKNSISYNFNTMRLKIKSNVGY